MKVIFNKNAIINAVAPLMCAVAKTDNPATEGILIEAIYPNVCVLTTFDERKGVRITIEAAVIEEGKYIVNAQKFNQTIKVMTGEEITLNIDQKFSACISCGKSSHKMTALDSEIFPMIFDLKSDRSFVVSQSVIKKMINQVSFAMGVNDPRTVLNGCYTQIRDDSITFVACDSYKLAKVSKFINIENRNTNNDAHLNFNFIIPSKTVLDLQKMLSDDEDSVMQIYITRKHIVFLIDEITFFSRLIDGDYIDYDRIIVKSHKIDVEVDRQELIYALERAALITEERIANSVRSHVKFDLVDGLLKISAVSSAGSTYDELDVNKNGDDLIIAFNNRFLIESVRACSADKIKLSLSSALIGMNIEPFETEEGTEQLFMLLPIRMKD